jgi:hypothetical protein
MDQARIALLGAALGGAASLAGVFATNRVTSRLESRRQRWSHQQAQLECLLLQDMERLMPELSGALVVLSTGWIGSASSETSTTPFRERLGRSSIDESTGAEAAGFLVSPSFW